MHRFPVTSGRARDCDARSAPLMARARSLTLAEQQAWLELQGPVSPALVDAVAGTDADVLSIHPYLFWPDVAAHAAARRRWCSTRTRTTKRRCGSRCSRRCSRRAPGLVFQVGAERRLCERRFAIAARRAITLGLGVDAGTGSAADARAAVGLGDRPYLLCLGRVDDGKGAPALRLVRGVQGAPARTARARVRRARWSTSCRRIPT